MALEAEAGFQEDKALSRCSGILDRAGWVTAATYPFPCRDLSHHL